ncbi:DMT family transporter [Staphylococcus gallinarum]|uniref:DMT family transporter n=2 Tax=Staphylococcus TaxID=1279 RepID=A0A2T4SXC5_STAGA|nr:DMT family transporter [Staphylococcus gallinarum]MBU7216703.1 DMT family transporter [Staphylococcus gallinarum]MCD8785645.1 DMT family transporter [Staphylococcus gallinarum]MCD8820599.1 DMT family transporter [Staphylococcus gallinarum]MCD8826491.1 DMT family transporter [Staphylococcus gallinarum]MCD8828958.1 DMT family transporter [Staphylococcus gallinarum]
MQIFIVISTLIAGITLSTQSAVNGSFSKKAGTLESAFLTFITGGFILFIITLFFGHGSFLEFFHAPKWQLAAVWFGVGYLFLTIVAIPKIGVISANISAVIGQLTMGMVIDHFGWFEGLTIHFDVKRVAALIIMLIALRLIYKAEIKNSVYGAKS